MYMDCTLPFVAPNIFTAVADAIAWALHYSGASSITLMIFVLHISRLWRYSFTYGAVSFQHFRCSHLTSQDQGTISTGHFFWHPFRHRQISASPPRAQTFPASIHGSWDHSCCLKLYCCLPLQCQLNLYVLPQCFTLYTKLISLHLPDPSLNTILSMSCVDHAAYRHLGSHIIIFQSLLHCFWQSIICGHGHLTRLFCGLPFVWPFLGSCMPVSSCVLQCSNTFSSRHLNWFTFCPNTHCYSSEAE